MHSNLPLTLPFANETNHSSNLGGLEIQSGPCLKVFKLSSSLSRGNASPFLAQLQAGTCLQSLAKSLLAQSGEKDVKHGSPSHHQLLNICFLTNPSWSAIWQMKTVSLGLKELDFSCSREGHLSPSIAGTGLLCPRAAASIPNWEQWQPCSRTVFWRWVPASLWAPS